MVEPSTGTRVVSGLNVRHDLLWVILGFLDQLSAFSILVAFFHLWLVSFLQLVTWQMRHYAGAYSISKNIENGSKTIPKWYRKWN